MSDACDRGDTRRCQLKNVSPEGTGAKLPQMLRIAALKGLAISNTDDQARTCGGTLPGASEYCVMYNSTIALHQQASAIGNNALRNATVAKEDNRETLVLGFLGLVIAAKSWQCLQFHCPSRNKCAPFPCRQTRSLRAVEFEMARSLLQCEMRY